MLKKETSFQQDSELGTIPSDWKILQSEDIFSLEYGTGLTESQRKGGIYPVMGSNGIVGYHDKSLVEGPGIVVGRKGSMGAVSWIDSSFWPIDTAYYVKPKFPNLSLKWLYYKLCYLNPSRFHLSDVVPGLRRDSVYALKMAIPPDAEQVRIAETLQTIDQAIQQTDETIAKTMRLKQGLMQELLTKGIRHEEVRESFEIETTIPKSWRICRLEQVAFEVTIGVVNPATPYYTTPEQGVPYFRSQNVRENRLEPTNIFVSKEFHKKHARSILKENDVLTLQTGFIGTSCLVPKLYEGSNCHSLLISRTNPEVLLPEFLCQLLNSPVGKRIIMRHQTGWGRNHLLLEDFRRLYLPIPSINEQSIIVDVLSSTDAKLDADKEEKSRLSKIKQGFMDLLLTGKVRIRAN